MATCLGSGKAGVPPDIPIGQAVHLVPLVRQRGVGFTASNRHPAIEYGVILPITATKSILSTIFLCTILNHLQEKDNNFIKT